MKYKKVFLTLYILGFCYTQSTIFWIEKSNSVLFFRIFGDSTLKVLRGYTEKVDSKIIGLFAAVSCIIFIVWFLVSLSTPSKNTVGQKI